MFRRLSELQGSRVDADDCTGMGKHLRVALVARVWVCCVAEPFLL